MKRFSCGDVVPGCEASWVAPSEDDLVELVEWHAAEAHGICELTPELIAAVRSNIRAVA